MRKWSMLICIALLALTPACAGAQELPQILGVVSQGIGEGLAAGLNAAADMDLSLSITAEESRIEEGRPLDITITAVNPRPADTPVSLSLLLPGRLAAEEGVAWEAQLPAAEYDEETGALTPSVTTFTRRITLNKGGASEKAAIGAELNMGTRFYRARLPVDLCVADISVSAAVDGAPDGLICAGDAFAYVVDIVNDGTAAKDVPIELALPDGVSAVLPLPQGLTLRGARVSGEVPVGAASSRSIRLDMTAQADVLDGDEDASRLLSGVLTADGRRVPLPRLMAVGPMVSARLVADTQSLKEGEETELAIVVTNRGQADADVVVQCMLPAGLTPLPQNGRQASADEEDSVPAAAEPKDGGAAGPDAAPALSAGVCTPEAGENGALVYTVPMRAAQAGEDGVIARTKLIPLRVKADMPLDNMNERLMGAALSYSVDGGEPQLTQAVAMRVYRSEFMGMSRSEWNGVLLAGLLMLVTVCCLYGAVRSGEKEEDYCLD